MEKTEQSNNKIDKITIRGHSKGVFFWPSMALALGFWLLDFLSIYSTDTLAWFWLLIFTLNVLVIIFEFGITKVAILVATILFILWAQASSGIELSVSEILDFNITVSPDFYGAITIFFIIIYILDFIGSRINYWEIELHGITQYTYPWKSSNGEFTPEEKISKVKRIYPDLFERILFLIAGGAGTIRIMTETEVYFIKNVINVGNKFRAVKKLGYKE